MIELSAKVINCVEELFSEKEALLVKELLINECGSNVPFCENRTSSQMDRIRLATLKLSNGSVLELKSAIKEACTDWRDLLMAAGFGHDTEAHKKWIW